MQFERDLWRRFGRNTRATIVADGERIELVDAGALAAEAAAASLAIHQASDRERGARLVRRDRGDLGLFWLRPRHGQRKQK